MKNILKLGLTACLAVAFVLSGCKKDDDDNNSSSSSSASIIGTWRSVSWVSIADGEEKKGTYEDDLLKFGADGSYYEENFEENRTWEGTYEIDSEAGQLFVKKKNYNSTFKYKYQLNGNTLILTEEGIGSGGEWKYEQTFRRL